MSDDTVVIELSNHTGGSSFRKIEREALLEICQSDKNAATMYWRALDASKTAFISSNDDVIAVLDNEYEEHWLGLAVDLGAPPQNLCAKCKANLEKT
jgi:hypothetical protein